MRGVAGGEIEKRPEAQLQRDMRRLTGAGPRRMTRAGAVMATGGSALVAVGGGLHWTVLVPFYFTAGVGALLVAVGAMMWLAQRRRAREEPPVPPARLLPP